MQEYRLNNQDHSCFIAKEIASLGGGGGVNENRLGAKAQYKRTIRAARTMYERKTNDRLLNSILIRDSQTF